MGATIRSSILNTIKKKLGPSVEYDAFDDDIIVAINSALMVATQIGVGPSEGFSITGASETWEDFLEEDEGKFEAVKDYIYLKTKLLFDPPANSFLVTAMEKQISEFEWRLNVRAEEGKDHES